MTYRVLAIGMQNPAAELLGSEYLGDHLSVFAADNRPDSLRLLFDERPHLIVIDVRCGRLDSRSLCGLIREMCDTPILCLAPAEAAETVVECLGAGADACATMPIGPLELKARVALLLRNGGYLGTPDAEVILEGDLAIDVKAHRVSKQGIPVALARREFQVLSILAQRRGCVVSHREILSQVWGPEYRNDTHYLRLYVGYLRRKLEDDPHRPHYIITERGVGYRLGRDDSYADSPSIADLKERRFASSAGPAFEERYAMSLGPKRNVTV